MDLCISLLSSIPLLSQSVSIHFPSTGTATTAMSLALARRPNTLDGGRVPLFPQH